MNNNMLERMLVGVSAFLYQKKELTYSPIFLSTVTEFLEGRTTWIENLPGVEHYPLVGIIWTVICIFLSILTSHVQTEDTDFKSKILYRIQTDGQKFWVESYRYLWIWDMEDKWEAGQRTEGLFETEAAAERYAQTLFGELGVRYMKAKTI